MSVNAPEAITQRVRLGKLSWAGPLIMLLARSVLALVSQGLVAILFFRGEADAWSHAGAWWRVYGTAVDLGCIALLVWLARREGIRLFDLGSYRERPWLRDILIGLALLVPVLALVLIAPGIAAGAMIYGGAAPLADPLPLWGVLYGLIV